MLAILLSEFKVFTAVESDWAKYLFIPWSRDLFDYCTLFLLAFTAELASDSARHLIHMACGIRACSKPHQWILVLESCRIIVQYPPRMYTSISDVGVHLVYKSPSGMSIPQMDIQKGYVHPRWIFHMDVHISGGDCTIMQGRN